uniref:Uncharacterized protein n=1 Tax=Sphaerodactylus townsendi TaxID=933632 RepID=A0ACB8G1T1_9SAUR
MLWKGGRAQQGRFQGAQARQDGSSTREECVEDLADGGACPPAQGAAPKSRGSLRGAPAARRKGLRANGAHSTTGLCRGSPSGAVDHLTGAQEKGAAQPTDAAHGSGGSCRGLPGAKLPNAPLASSTWPPPLQGALLPCAASVDCAAPDVPFSWAGHR